MKDPVEHLDIDEALALRDGDGSAAALSHVESCDRCRQEVERLRRLRAELRALPALRSGEDVWPRVIGKLSRKRRLRWAAVGAVWLAAATLAGLLILREPGPDAVSERPRAEAPVSVGRSYIVPAELVPYIDRSRELENVLATYVPENPVLDARRALAVSVLEERLLLIDEALLKSGAAGVDDPLLVNLWGQRVQALETLVGVQLVDQEQGPSWSGEGRWR